MQPNIIRIENSVKIKKTFLSKNIDWEFIEKEIKNSDPKKSTPQNDMAVK